MEKDIYTELNDGLKEMAKDELTKAIEAIESDELPSVPMIPSKVIRKVYEIARHHKMTADEFGNLLSLLNTASSTERRKMLEEYRKSLEEGNS